MYGRYNIAMNYFNALLGIFTYYKLVYNKVGRLIFSKAIIRMFLALYWIFFIKEFFLLTKRSLCSMKISAIIQPPSLAAQLEGKILKALNLKIKELNQKRIEDKQKNAVSAQNKIDLLT